MQPSRSKAASADSTAAARVIDAFNPGVTMLVAIWSVGLALRGWLARNGLLTELGDDALRSLIYVVPVMLVGWGLLTVADRRFGLGLLRRRDSGD